MESHIAVKECVGSSERYLIAQQEIKAGKVIASWVLSGGTLQNATIHSIQTGLNEHTEVTGLLKFTSHCCRYPNAAFDFNSSPWSLVAIRDIKEGEAITYDYVTTEYKMMNVFGCLCESESCRKVIRGFYYLADEEKEFLYQQGSLSPVLKLLYDSEKSK